MSASVAATAVLGASAGAAIGVVLYVGIVALVLRLAVRWAREAPPSPDRGDPERGPPPCRPSSRRTAASSGTS